MYLPKHFEQSDARQCVELIERFPFATIITIEDGKPFVNHLPLVVKKVDGALLLVGHVSTRNPQLVHFKQGHRATVVFNGPHAYITPRWYAANHVPTWNYAVVQVTGKVAVLESYSETVAVLRTMTEKFEPEQAWSFEIPDDLKSDQDLISSIAAFQIEVSEIKGKFKLSQNRSEKDRLGVIEGLKLRGDELSRQVSELMTRA